MEEQPGQENVNIHPDTLKEQPPTFLLETYETVTHLIASNGWYILFSGIALALIWSKAKPHIDKYLADQDQRAEEARMKKDPELYRSRQLALEIAREKMQLEHDRRAELAEEQRQQKDAARRAEKLSKLSSVNVGHRLQGDATAKPEYNPLSGGSGGAGGYRPTRRSCPGGGCG